MEQNRPTGRKKVVTDNSLGVHKRGEGQGTGPVGTGSRPGGVNRPGGSDRGGGQSGGDGGNRSAGPTRSGGKSPLIIIILLIVVLLGGGKGFLSGGLGGSDTGASESVMESLAGNPTSASTSA